MDSEPTLPGQLYGKCFHSLNEIREGYKEEGLEGCEEKEHQTVNGKQACISCKYTACKQC